MSETITLWHLDFTWFTLPGSLIGVITKGWWQTSLLAFTGGFSGERAQNYSTSWKRPIHSRFHKEVHNFTKTNLMILNTPGIVLVARPFRLWTKFCPKCVLWIKISKLFLLFAYLSYHNAKVFQFVSQKFRHNMCITKWSIGNEILPPLGHP